MLYRMLLASLLVVGVTVSGRAQKPTDNSTVSAAVRKQLQDYVEKFNQHDSAALATYWTSDAVSVNEESGERTVGREAIAEDFTQLFTDYPNASLSGAINELREIAPGVVIAEGQVAVRLDEGEPTEASFTAVFTKQEDQWLISSSHERPVQVPQTSFDALQPLQWLIGTWRDETEGATVETTVRWSP